METKQFILNTDEPKPLAQISDNKIIIRKVKVISGDITDLFTPIQVKTIMPTGDMYSYYVHATSYFSNKSKGIETDIPMEVVIRNCKFTELLIKSATGKKSALAIEYTLIPGEPLQIEVREDLDGYTFTLTTDSKEIILSKFPNVRPMRSIFVGYDTRLDFESMHGTIEKYILPALTNLTEDQLNQIGHTSLVDAYSKKIIKRI